MVQLSIPGKKMYFVSARHQKLLDYVETRSNNGHNVNVLVKGLAGCGKSELADAICG